VGDRTESVLSPVLGLSPSALLKKLLVLGRSLCGWGPWRWGRVQNAGAVSLQGGPSLGFQGLGGLSRGAISILEGGPRHRYAAHWGASPRSSDAPLAPLVPAEPMLSRLVGARGLGRGAERAFPQLQARLYHENIVDHYENPRNVGSLDKNDPNVGTVRATVVMWSRFPVAGVVSLIEAVWCGQGLVGAPACGDVMKLQIKVRTCAECVGSKYNSLGGWSSSVAHLLLSLYVMQARIMPGNGPLRRPECRPLMVCSPVGTQVDANGKIIESKFKTFGCGSAIASSSVATEWLKGKTVDECLEIKNTDIASHLKLPPVKLHCRWVAGSARPCASVSAWRGCDNVRR
jgi:NifU-like protein involved in Fe-S cluster formation